MVTHRYLGVIFGVLMLLWFASGVVMLFVRWPEVTPEARTASLAPIPWTRCCAVEALAPEETIRRASLEEMAGRPVLRLSDRTVDLSTGRLVDRVSRTEALRIAETWARANRVAGRPLAVHSVERDQWTVTGYFDSRRPFWRVAFSDPALTVVHVSARTGEVAQATTRRQRVLAWLGPIPHWLYPEVLRQDAKLWTQVVVWTSTAGLFLTVTGIYLGLIAWRPWGHQRTSPYRGLMKWHHLTGLAAGLLTLTWTFSGLLSMQPWGLLESGPDPGREGYEASAITGAQLAAALTALQAKAPEARQVRLAPLEGGLFLMADGRRLDGGGEPAALEPDQLARAARALGPIQSQGMMTAEDPYHYGHHAPVRLPVWRVIIEDGRRYYLDPASGEVLRAVDLAAKGDRWLFRGLHRLDVLPGFDRGPGWAAAMVALLVFAGAGVATGVWLGVRRLRRDLTRPAAARRA